MRPSPPGTPPPGAAAEPPTGGQEAPAATLRRLREELAAAERARDVALQQRDEAREGRQRFLGVLARELRTPLMGVLGSIDLLRASPLNHAQHKLVGLIDRSGADTLQVIDSLLEAGDREHLGAAAEPQPFELRRAVEEAVLVIEPRARAKALSVLLDYDLDLPLRVMGDPLRLSQLLLHSLGQAVRSCSSATLRLSVRPVGEGRVRIELDRPAAPSLLGSSGPSPALAAALCVTMAEALGGGFTEAPARGGQLRMAIELPMPEAPSAAGEAEPTLISMSGLRVLVAEDNAFNREVIALQLDAMGADASLCEDGEAALNHGKENVYDAILMDIEMPVRDGLSATRALRAAGCTAPILAITASADRAARAAAQDAGMDGFVVKPVDRRGLEASLREAIGRHRNVERSRARLQLEALRQAVRGPPGEGERRRARAQALAQTGS